MRIETLLQSKIRRVPTTIKKRARKILHSKLTITREKGTSIIIFWIVKGDQKRLPREILGRGREQND
jgi:hypothetical protein